MKLSLIILLFVFGGTIADDGDAKIILVKSILNNIITEGSDLAVEYNLFNIGDK